MRVTVNGEPRELAPDATVAAVTGDVAGEVAGGHHRVAVAVNGEVVPGAAWDATALADGDRIEIVTAIQGGR